MYKTKFQTYAVKMEDIVTAFDRIGFERMLARSRVPNQVIIDALSMNPEGRNAFIRGQAEFFPLQYQEWKNGSDIIQGLDYELREPIRVTTDPVIIVTEVVYGRTSYLVKEALDRELEIDFVKSARMKGVNSNDARRCITELADLRNENPTYLYSKYADWFHNTWVPILNGERPPVPIRERNAETKPKAVYDKTPVRVRT